MYNIYLIKQKRYFEIRVIGKQYPIFATIYSKYTQEHETNRYSISILPARCSL